MGDHIVYTYQGVALTLVALPGGLPVKTSAGASLTMTLTEA